MISSWTGEAECHLASTMQTSDNNIRLPASTWNAKSDPARTTDESQVVPGTNMIFAGSKKGRKSPM